MGASNITLFAKWKAQPTLTFTYDGNGKTSGVVPVDTNKYSSGDSVLLPGNSGGLVKTGFSFGGWNTKADGSGTDYNAGSKFPMPSSSAVLFAKWTTKPIYLVVYNKNGADSGSIPAEAGYEAGATVTVSDNTGKLAKTGNTFAGWNTQANGNGTNYAPGATFVKGPVNDTLFAKWSGYSYTVTYDDQSATTPVSPSTKVVASPATTVGSLPVAPVKTGFTFGGWFTAASGGGTEFTATTAVTGSITVFAKWTTVPVFAITFNKNDAAATGAMADQSIASGSSAALTANAFVKAGWMFAGWAIAAGGDVSYADKANYTMGAANVTLFAKWVATSLTVTFDKNDAAATGTMADQPIASGASASLSANAFIKPGWTFAGWATTASGTVAYADQATYAMGTANVTLFAKWTANSLKVTFDKNDAAATGAMADQTIASGASAVLTANGFAKPGWTFAGWATTASGTMAYADQANYTMGTANVTLYAKWTANTLTITFNKNDPNATGTMSDQTIISGTLGTLKQNAFTKTCNKFSGWATTAGGPASFTDQANYTMGTANVTLYAVWQIESHTITFNKNDNNATGTMANQSINCGASAALTAKGFSKPGWNFAGWATTSGGDSAYANQANFTMGNTDVQLYATWKIAQYSVMYNGNGNSSGAVPTSSATYTTGTTVTVLANPGKLVKNSSSFMGWNTASDGSGPTYACGATFAMETQNVVLYAQYSATSVMDNDGNIYSSVIIGAQTWMVPNLKTTKYNDGTNIQLETDNSAWNTSTTTTPAYCWYDNDIGFKNPYGALYNWYAVNTGKLAPAGWHVATKADWNTMLTTLEPSPDLKIKESGLAHWIEDVGTNETRFTALPGGYRNGPCASMGTYGYWWTYGVDFESGDFYFLWSGGSGGLVPNYDVFQYFGHSVRCVKD
jgi:uncharacterized protein (TIGR02145 family)/uncharacterized repeat protein (TIGR02543 family)